MADRNVVISFDADLDGMKPAIDLLLKMGAIDKATADSFRQNNQTYEQRNVLVDQYGKALTGVAETTEKAKAATEKLNEAVKETGAEAERTGTKFKESTKNSAEGVDKLFNSIKQLGAAIGIGFGINEIIRFGRESVAAFADAQKSAQQLLFALNNNREAQERLIISSKTLGKSAAIEPDVIVKQQAFLAVQGRTEEQIKKTIQAAIQLSAVTGDDLGSSVFKLSATYEGQIGRLGKLGAEFKDLSQSELRNGAAVDLINEKYKGFAESTLETAAGKLQQQRVRVEELKQEIGEGLTPVLLNLQEVLLSAGEGLFNVFSGESFRDETFQEKFDKARRFQTELIALNKYSTDQLIADRNRLEEVQKTQEGDQRTQSLGFIKAIQDELKARQQNTGAIKEEGVSLAKLREELADLQKQQEELTDPFGVNAAKAENLKDQIAEKNRIIDELTGKAEEDRQREAERKAKEAQAKAEQREREKQSSLKEIRDTFAKAEIDGLEDDEQKKLAQAQKEFDDTVELLEEALDKQFITQEDFNGRILQAEQNLEDAKARIRTEAEDKLIKKRSDDRKKRIDDEKAAADELQSLLEKSNDDTQKKEEKHQEEILRIKQEALERFRDLSDVIASSEIDAINFEADQRIEALNQQKEKELENKRLTSEQKKQIEARYQKEEAKIRHDAAVKIRQADIIQAGVNTLLAVTAILADHTVSTFLKPFLIGSALATGALQVAAITSKPLPQFKHGKEKVEGPGTATSDSIMAMLSKGERVIDAETNEKYFPLLSAIHNKKISPDIAASLAKALPNLKTIPETPNFSDSDISNLLVLSSSGVDIDYDAWGYHTAKYLYEITEKGKHRDRYKERSMIETLKSLKPQPIEPDLRRR